MKKAAQLHVVPAVTEGAKVKSLLKQAAVAGFGVSINDAFELGQRPIIDAIKDYAAQNEATQAAAMQEIMDIRESKQEACKPLKLTLNKRKYQAIAANYSRLLRIMKAIKAKVNVALILSANSLNEMTAFIPPTKGSKVRSAHGSPLTASNITHWTEKAQRILPSDMVKAATGKTATDKDKVELADRIAGLERAFNSILAELARPAVANMSSLPIQAILQLAKGKQAKAA